MPRQRCQRRPWRRGSGRHPNSSRADWRRSWQERHPCRHRCRRRPWRSHAVPGGLNPRRFGCLYERKFASIADVAEQPVGGQRSAVPAGQRSALYQPDVQPTVTVEIQNADAGADDLNGPQFAHHAAVVHEVEAGGSRHVNESNIPHDSPSATPEPAPTSVTRLRGLVNAALNLGATPMCGWASKSPNVCTAPPGQWTVTSVTRDRSPRPKWTRGSFEAK